VLDRVCLLGLRVALAVGAALFTVNLLPYFDGASDLSALLSPFQRLAGDGVIFWDLVFGTSVPALLVMAGRARRASGTERNRVRIFLLSITLAFTPIVAQVLLEGMFPGYMRLMRTPSGMVWSGLFVYPPVLLLPLATAYTVASSERFTGAGGTAQGAEASTCLVACESSPLRFRWSPSSRICFATQTRR
jgi:hypothetical protein